MEFAISDLVREIAAGMGDAEAVVTPGRRISWASFDALGDLVASSLAGAGLGCDGDTSRISAVEDRVGSVQSHVGILAGNSPEYLATMLGAFRARCVPVNVNYRYTADEIAYVVRDADLDAFVYHARYAPALAAALEETGPVRLLIRIEDGSGVDAVPGSTAWGEHVSTIGEAERLGTCTGDDRYLLYTGGTTGFPKGVAWRQQDWYFACLGGNLRRFTAPEEVVSHALSGRRLIGLPASPMIHGAGHWTSFSVLLQGGTVVLPREPDRLDAAGIWEAVEREGVVFLQVIGDAFLGPLLDEVDRGDYDLSSLRFVLSSGAIASPSRKAALRARLPKVVVQDTVGASESGTTAISDSRHLDEGEASVGTTFRLQDGAVVLAPGTWALCEEGEQGLLAQSGHVPLGYYKDVAKTEATFPVVDGVRYSVPGDHAVRTAGGGIRLLGRGSGCINTGGEKVYPEEVEAALKGHVDVIDALVAGVPDPDWGEAVGAVVQVRPSALSTGADLGGHLRATLAGYKVPRRWVLQEEPVGRNSVGKPDYRWARERLGSASMPDP